MVRSSAEPTRIAAAQAAEDEMPPTGWEAHQARLVQANIDLRKELKDHGGVVSPLTGERRRGINGR